MSASHSLTTTLYSLSLAVLVLVSSRVLSISIELISPSAKLIQRSIDTVESTLVYLSQQKSFYKMLRPGLTNEIRVKR